MLKEITCIGCPIGCRISAVLENGEIQSISGYSCNVGKKYAQEELTAPKRMVTALMTVRGSRHPLPVKTSQPIDKSKIFDCLNEIAGHTVSLPVHIGDVVLPGVCGSNVNIVATKELL
ncbi:DUF1667 domain-containing protein [Oscillospiraceae bacterium LTW-04]|nr:DUF1667 domain-containing protein [Oscillospiraceae bacterium MB24-C1]